MMDPESDRCDGVVKTIHHEQWKLAPRGQFSRAGVASPRCAARWVFWRMDEWVLLTRQHSTVNMIDMTVDCSSASAKEEQFTQHLLPSWTR